MSNETTASAEQTDETTSTPDQHWGKVALCAAIAIVAALVIHYAMFAVVFEGADLSPTVHAFIGMVLFFVAGFVSFSVFY